MHGGLQGLNQSFLRGSGSVCETVHHQGHEGTRRKDLKPQTFVTLRAHGGSWGQRLQFLRKLWGGFGERRKAGKGLLARRNGLGSRLRQFAMRSS